MNKEFSDIFFTLEPKKNPPSSALVSPMVIVPFFVSRLNKIFSPINSSPLSLNFGNPYTFPVESFKPSAFRSERLKSNSICSAFNSCFFNVISASPLRFIFFFLIKSTTLSLAE